MRILLLLIRRLLLLGCITKNSKEVENITAKITWRRVSRLKTVRCSYLPAELLSCLSYKPAHRTLYTQERRQLFSRNWGWFCPFPYCRTNSVLFTFGSVIYKNVNCVDLVLRRKKSSAKKCNWLSQQQQLTTTKKSRFRLRGRPVRISFKHHQIWKYKYLKSPASDLVNVVLTFELFK